MKTCREIESLNSLQRCSDICRKAFAAHVPAIINNLIIVTTLFIESLLTSLCQREGKSPLERGAGVCNPSLVKRGKGRFSDSYKFNFKNLNNCIFRVKDKARYPVSFGVVFFVIGFLLISICGCGAKYYVKPKADVDKIKKVAVFPLENFTSDEYAGEKIRRLVITELLMRGIDVVEPGEVTRMLRESKVKSIGSIKTTEMQNMGKTMGVDAVMSGSVEALGIGRGVSVSYPEVSLQLMLVDVSSGSIIWSVQHTVGGASFWTRHFGTEGITLSEAARKAVKEAVGTLF